MLARAPGAGSHGAITVTCMQHRDGNRCNKNLNIGDRLNEAECYRRVKEWCSRGLASPDGPGAREMHVADLPRQYADVDARSAEEFQRAAREL